MRGATAEGLVVIPTGGPDGKRPAVGKGWQLRGLATDAELLEWARQASNYGVLTGDAVDVMDIDDGREGHSAEQLLQLLAERLGLPEDWETRIVATGGGGYHVYIRHVPGASSAQSVAGLPIEYKSHGRMVVGPGSIHGETGREYVVVNPGVPIAAVPSPARLLAALGGHPTLAAPPLIGTHPLQAPRRRRLKARSGVSAGQALARAEARIAAAEERSRDNTLNTQVYLLGPYVQSGELERSEVERICGRAARRTRPSGAPGLGAKQVRATLKSACDAGELHSAPDEDDPPSPGAGRACEDPPSLRRPRSTARARRKPYRPLTPWDEERLLPALALIWRACQATPWTWKGARLDRVVLDLLLGRAQMRCDSLEVEPTLRWLAARTGVHTHYIRAALARLQEHGWLHLVRQGGPTGEHSPRAPSTFGLCVPRALAAPWARYPESLVRRVSEVFPMLPRAHQLKDLPLRGSCWAGLASEPSREGVVGDALGPSQGLLWVDGEEGSPDCGVRDVVLVRAGSGDVGAGLRRATRRQAWPGKKSAPAHRRCGSRWSSGRGVLEPELVSALEALEAAGLAPAIVGRTVVPRRARRGTLLLERPVPTPKAWAGPR